MAPPLGGKVIILIGGLGLIGRGLAAGVVEAGARVVVASRSAGRADALAVFDGLAPAQRERIEAIAVDINDPPSVDGLLTEVARRHQRVDAVVNCAYPQQDDFGTRFEDVRYEVFYDNVGRHVGGFFLVAQRSFLFFREQGHGNLINFSSIYGGMVPRFEIYEGTPMTKEVEYSVAKASIVQLTKYLAAYAKGLNIRVNCISPGGVLNQQNPLFLEKYNAHCATKGLLAPEDLAGTLIYLLSDGAVYVTGQNIVVDDGFSL